MAAGGEMHAGRRSDFTSPAFDSGEPPSSPVVSPGLVSSLSRISEDLFLIDSVVAFGSGGSVLSRASFSLWTFGDFRISVEVLLCRRCVNFLLSAVAVLTTGSCFRCVYDGTRRLELLSVTFRSAKIGGFLTCGHVSLTR
ncbi:hypothetical protein F2Q69_00030507 [Brassica cretica]|uniref:Uncharacterized protein n=1 Tax=Brassica cretica TaxID=69181 RepID=A0A8S9S7X3_BRACR|nr:hypothetical protein F2Q69_00030507 [Brassica cretica]